MDVERVVKERGW